MRTLVNVSVWLFMVVMGIAPLADAAPREVSVVLRPGYAHGQTIALFKRNLRLQGWRVTARQGAIWQIRLCASAGPSTQICMKKGKRWRLFRGPKRKISASTRARLLLLYFNMMQMQPARSKQSSGVGCGCGVKPRPAPVKRRINRRVIRAQRAHHSEAKQPLSPAPGAQANPTRRAPQIAAPTPQPRSTPLRREPPKKRTLVAKVDDDDEDTFGDLVNTRTMPTANDLRDGWGWWFAAAISGDVYWSGEVDVRPGGTIHLRTGWGRFGVHMALQLHAYFLATERSILLVRPSFALEWTFWPKRQIGRAAFSFGLHAGLITEHNVSEAADGTYSHNMQVGPKLGGQIHWQFSDGWSLFWRSSVAVAFAPGDDSKSPLFQWQNDLGLQFRVHL